MEIYNEADIHKLINDCEILFLPENASLEDVLTAGCLTEGQKQESQHESGQSSSSIEETEVDFKRFYTNSKAKRSHNVAVS